jgi:hypothetical protein
MFQMHPRLDPPISFALKQNTMFYIAHPLSFFLLLIFFPISMLNHHEPSSYVELLAILEFEACQEVFLRAGWGKFLASLQGNDDDVSLKFSLGLDEKFSCVGSLVFPVSEESISMAMKLP